MEETKNVNHAPPTPTLETQTAPNQISFATRSNMMCFYCVSLMEATMVMDA